MVSHPFFYQLARQPAQPIYAGYPPPSRGCRRRCRGRLRRGRTGRRRLHWRGRRPRGWRGLPRQMAPRQRNPGVSLPLSGRVGDSEVPREGLHQTVLGDVADSGGHPGRIGRPALQEHLMGEQAPGRIANLGNAGWHRRARGVREGHGIGIDSRHRFREDGLHHDVFIDVGRARRRVGGDRLQGEVF